MFRSPENRVTCPCNVGLNVINPGSLFHEFLPLFFTVTVNRKFLVVPLTVISGEGQNENVRDQ